MKPQPFRQSTPEHITPERTLTGVTQKDTDKQDIGFATRHFEAANINTAYNHAAKRACDVINSRAEHFLPIVSPTLRIKPETCVHAAVAGTCES